MSNPVLTSTNATHPIVASLINQIELFTPDQILTLSECLDDLLVQVPHESVNNNSLYNILLLQRAFNNAIRQNTLLFV